MVYEINGSRFHTLEEFFDEIRSLSILAKAVRRSALGAKAGCTP
jgi:hypothetical protein